MSKWCDKLRNEVYTEVKEYLNKHYRINARYEPNEILMKKMITTVLNNIPYGKYVKYVERSSFSHLYFHDILISPYPADSFFYKICYKTGKMQLIRLSWYNELPRFPIELINMIYYYVRYNRKYFKDAVNYINDWYFRPSRCLEVHEELNRLYQLSGMDDKVIKTLKEMCR